MRSVIGLLVLAVVTVAAGRAEAELAAVTEFGANPGQLDMFEYVPAGLAPNRPLVVVLHGCTQTAASMEAAGWNTLADTYRFAVLYPQQRTANQSLDCFTWYDTGDLQRDAGEPASIVAMIDHEIATNGSDRDRVYVTGLSAGGAFTTIMLATYPDRFAAGSSMAGLPYACATSIATASACQQMTAAANRTPAAWGDLVRAAAPTFTGSYPRLQIWQGTADYTVAPANAGEIVEQWTNLWGIDQTPDATATIGAATRDRFLAAGGTIAVERYLIEGMGHAVATGTDELGVCPATSGAFFANVQICSTLRAAEFFDLLDDDGPGPGDDDGDDAGGDDAANPGNGGGCCATSSGVGSLLGAALVAGVGLAFYARRRRRR